VHWKLKCGDGLRDQGTQKMTNFRQFCLVDVVWFGASGPFGRLPAFESLDRARLPKVGETIHALSVCLIISLLFLPRE
jgi:hypothetical protein